MHAHRRRLYCSGASVDCLIDVGLDKNSVSGGGRARSHRARKCTLENGSSSYRQPSIFDPHV